MSQRPTSTPTSAPAGANRLQHVLAAGLAAGANQPKQEKLPEVDVTDAIADLDRMTLDTEMKRAFEGGNREEFLRALSTLPGIVRLLYIYTRCGYIHWTREGLTVYFRVVVPTRIHPRFIEAIQQSPFLFSPVAGSPGVFVRRGGEHLPARDRTVHHSLRGNFAGDSWMTFGKVDWQALAEMQLQYRTTIREDRLPDERKPPLLAEQKVPNHEQIIGELVRQGFLHLQVLGPNKRPVFSFHPPEAAVAAAGFNPRWQEIQADMDRAYNALMRPPYCFYRVNGPNRTFQLWYVGSDSAVQGRISRWTDINLLRLSNERAQAQQRQREEEARIEAQRQAARDARNEGRQAKKEAIEQQLKDAAGDDAAVAAVVAEHNDWWTRQFQDRDATRLARHAQRIVRDELGRRATEAERRAADEARRQADEKQRRDQEKLEAVRQQLRQAAAEGGPEAVDSVVSEHEAWYRETFDDELRKLADNIVVQEHEDQLKPIFARNREWNDNKREPIRALPMLQLERFLLAAAQTAIDRIVKQAKESNDQYGNNPLLRALKRKGFVELFIPLPDYVAPDGKRIRMYARTQPSKANAALKRKGTPPDDAAIEVTFNFDKGSKERADAERELAKKYKSMTIRPNNLSNALNGVWDGMDKDTAQKEAKKWAMNKPDDADVEEMPDEYVPRPPRAGNNDEAGPSGAPPGGQNEPEDDAGDETPRT